MPTRPAAAAPTVPFTAKFSTNANGAITTIGNNRFAGDLDGDTAAHVTALDAAHAVMISHPDVVADVIMHAVSPRPLVSGRVA